MSSDPIRGTTEIPQAVRQSTRMPPTLPWLTDSAVTGSLASRKAALQQFNESMDTWWRRTRAAVQSDYEELAAGASSAITTSTDMASALRNEVQERVSQNETIVARSRTYSNPVPPIVMRRSSASTTKGEDGTPSAGRSRSASWFRGSPFSSRISSRPRRWPASAGRRRDPRAPGTAAPTRAARPSPGRHGVPGCRWDP